MAVKNLKIQVIFIGKPQWEAGWPYIGYDNEAFIRRIQDHLKGEFNDVLFEWSELIINYNENLVKEIKENILRADGIIIFTIGHYRESGIVQAGIYFGFSKRFRICDLGPICSIILILAYFYTIRFIKIDFDWEERK